MVVQRQDTPRAVPEHMPLRMKNATRLPPCLRWRGELHKQRNNAVRVAKPASVGQHARTQSLASAWRSVEKNPAASGVMESGGVGV